MCVCVCVCVFDEPELESLVGGPFSFHILPPPSGCEYQGEWFNKNNCAVSILRSGTTVYFANNTVSLSAFLYSVKCILAAVV